MPPGGRMPNTTNTHFVTLALLPPSLFHSNALSEKKGSSLRIVAKKYKKGIAKVMSREGNGVTRPGKSKVFGQCPPPPPKILVFVRKKGKQQEKIRGTKKKQSERKEDEGSGKCMENCDHDEEPTN
ncbi:hypothetical protein IE53DRAFT_71335 [Violaceomyces palustris]|uniref:Uncharacterized protein n=1 Tax=Violaceomyces palustris TaxID=1673888 RepID=A0ACD0P725_9BASI|nr:hypothetical protein IE53DRAFT_71335 [Violaceomyces palustris]